MNMKSFAATIILSLSSVLAYAQVSTQLLLRHFA